MGNYVLSNITLPSQNYSPEFHVGYKRAINTDMVSMKESTSYPETKKLSGVEFYLEHTLGLLSYSVSTKKSLLDSLCSVCTRCYARLSTNIDFFLQREKLGIERLCTHR